MKKHQIFKFFRNLFGLLLVIFGLVQVLSIKISTPVYALDYDLASSFGDDYKVRENSLPMGPEAIPITVGVDCDFPTISAAISAASPGSVIDIEGGVTFNEQLNIDKDLTLRGGYAGCDSESLDMTTIDGTSISGSVVEITSGDVELSDLEITNGTTFWFGGGIAAYDSAIVVIDHVDVVLNQAGGGGGIYIGPDTTLTATNESWISSNIGDGGGGGVLVYQGTFLAEENTTVELNTGIDGGGIFVYSGTVTLEDAWVTENDAIDLDSTGGGIYAAGNSTVNVFSSSISDNYAYYGAGIYADGSTVIGAVGFFHNNEADVDGGAFYLTNNAVLEGGSLRIGGEDLILGNQALNGAGIYAITSTVDIAGSQIYNNISDENGGGVYLDSSDLLAENCSFKYNQANVHGGAVAAFDSIVTIETNFDSCDPGFVVCSSISENVADRNMDEYGTGGGIHNDGSDIYLDHIVFFDNIAHNGGGLYQLNPDSYSQVQNSLLYRNTVMGDRGAGIRIYQGYFRGEHMTLANNSGAPALSTSGSDNIEIFNSIIWGNLDGGFDGTLPIFGCNIDQEGSIGVASDPLFLDPGIGDDYHLQYGSPAIDACTTGLPLDLDSLHRPLNGLFDMGVYESWARLFLPLTLH